MSDRRSLILIVGVGFPFLGVGIAFALSGIHDWTIGLPVVALLVAALAVPGFFAARLDRPWPWGALVGLAWAAAAFVFTYVALVGNSTYGPAMAMNGAVGDGLPVAALGLGWLVGFALYYWAGTARRTTDRD